MSATGNPSWWDARQNTSNPDNSRTASARWPSSRNRSPSPSARWSAATSSSCGPRPMATNLASGAVSSTVRAAWSRSG